MKMLLLRFIVSSLRNRYISYGIGPYNLLEKRSSNSNSEDDDDIFPMILG